MVRLVLIEEQSLVRESLATSLALLTPAEVVGQFNDLRSLREARDTVARAEVGLLDLRLEDLAPSDLAWQVQRLAPSLRLVWCTSITQDYLLEQAFSANLPGFVHKTDRLHVLINAIRTVASGGYFVSPSVVHLRERAHSKPDHFRLLLSDREQEVLQLIGSGFNNDDAAAVLSVSPGTVQSHRRNIMSRLDLHSAAELQAYAIANGFTNRSALINGARRN